LRPDHRLSDGCIAELIWQMPHAQVGGNVKLEIVRRHFAKIDDKWFELEDLNKRGLTADRAWSSFCAFFRAGDPEVLAANMRKHVTPPHIDIVVSPTDSGVWVLGAYYHLEAALPRLTMLGNLEAAE
jgi:hypothetical protein